MLAFLWEDRSSDALSIVTSSTHSRSHGALIQSPPTLPVFLIIEEVPNTFLSVSSSSSCSFRAHHSEMRGSWWRTLSTLNVLKKISKKKLDIDTHTYTVSYLGYLLRLQTSFKSNTEKSTVPLTDSNQLWETLDTPDTCSPASSSLQNSVKECDVLLLNMRKAEKRRLVVPLALNTHLNKQHGMESGQEPAITGRQVHHSLKQEMKRMNSLIALYTVLVVSHPDHTSKRVWSGYQSTDRILTASEHGN